MFIRRAAIAAAAIAAPLAFAAPAMADTPSMDIQCAPCVPPSTTPIWTAIFANGPWEPFFEATDGDTSNGQGAWETGVQAINGGAWEKAFPAG
jgi:hypothetical protein